ncbi:MULTISPECIES: class I SAM-dependent methyltransferase [unclassified Pedobacter]|uniref:class I SAM-dependent methyltransferase n=1 Tax=unclassified Pedobacter TaxID=2628915 RepID=UPI00141EE81C|nr:MULTISPECIES: class I SAM-dependent methyltransferase [unclassified Pedobacter]NII82295.1 16S rRNA G966 N2-methylase RsmD [Pedobacter sp. SG908]NMN36319.1 16S rRNA G966 N2-methylase RsmD [Pedobacter sp. SG918]
MNNNLLAKAVQDYISANLNADVNQVALAKSPFEGITPAELATQIISKKKSEKKLPTWFNTEDIYYPPVLSIEQTSSEITAEYKSKLAKGDTLIDITGGFGIDSYYFSRKVKAVTHCEINSELSAIAQHNARVLHTTNIEFKAEDGIAYIQNSDASFDTIYVDPARRAEKGKVFMLKDCTPDIVSNLDTLLEKSSRIIVKTAPLLDISAGLSELKQVSEIHIVSIKNECKELLWIIDKGYQDDTKIRAVTLNNEIEKDFSFHRSSSNASVLFTDNLSQGDYLYEPDAALLKSGAFNLIGTTYSLFKLHPQTQLFNTNLIKADFPGRIFKIEAILSTGELKKASNLKGNVIVRNYPAKPEDLVKKYKIKADQDQFLIFTKIANGENVILKASIIQYY